MANRKRNVRLRFDLTGKEKELFERLTIRSQV